MRLTQIHRFSERLLSNVQRGTAFEHRALELLKKHMSMSLTHVGGSYDGGVDLIGWWWVPTKDYITTRACANAYLSRSPLSSLHCLSDPLDATVAPMGSATIANRRRFRVIVQCKAEKKKMGPAYLRELEGVVHSYAAAATITGIQPHPSESEFPCDPQAMFSNEDPKPTPTAEAKEPASPLPPPLIAVLVSQSAFTRRCRLAANASPLPVLLVHIPPLPPPSANSSGGSGGDDGGGGGGGGAIGTIFGNPALLSAKGVLGGKLEIRWEYGGASGGILSSKQPLGMLSGVVTGRPGLWWQGQPLPSWTPEAGTGVDGGT